MNNIELMKKDLKNMMSDFRYKHSLSVADEAVLLAKRYGVNIEEAYETGLLHDMAKEVSSSENERIINKYHLSKEWLSPQNANILHAMVGSYLAMERYDLKEEEVLAIRYHAIGDEKMDLLAKIIFIADKIGRQNLNDNLLKVKELDYQDIDEALKEFLIYQSANLTKKGVKLHENTSKLLQKLQNKNAD